MPDDSDLIVVGSGAGGAALAYACAKAGKSVLLLERGGEYVPDQSAHDEQATLIDKKPYDDREIEVNGTAKRLYMGGSLGGGTSLFGGALLRPSRDDFHPGRHYGNRLPRAIWDWPISYEDLASHYSEAEAFFGVAGDRNEDFGPLQKPERPFPNQPLPLHAANQKLISANRASGLRPFRLPLAIEPTRCLRCAACAGYVCPSGARGSSVHLLKRAAAEGLRLQVLTNCEVEKLSFAGNGNAVSVDVLDRTTKARSTLRARTYVLAAGAIGSTLLLLRSGTDDPLIGRHYMLHLSPLAIGLFSKPNGADESFVKQVGFADYYFGTKKFFHKLGLIQSLPVPGPLLTKKMAPIMPRAAVRFLRRRMLPLCGIVEDLPNPDNRVELGSNGRPRLHHRFNEYDLERGKHLGQLMTRILKTAGAVACITKSFPSDEHVAHQCGTLRFGKDPSNAVLDKNCRMFKHPNVFVVDGSFLPTSLGVGPALTIIANALRVAKVLS